MASAAPTRGWWRRAVLNVLTPIQLGFAVLQATATVAMAFVAVLGVLYLIEEQRDRRQIRVTHAWNLFHAARSDQTSSFRNIGQIEAIEALYRNGANLRSVDFSGLYLHGLDLSCVEPGMLQNGFCADLRHADLSRTVLTNARFSGADVRHVRLADARTERANFSGALLTPMSFARSEFDIMFLSGARLHMRDGTGLTAPDAAETDTMRITINRLLKGCWDADMKPEIDWTKFLVDGVRWEASTACLDAKQEIEKFGEPLISGTTKHPCRLSSLLPLDDLFCD